MSALFVLSPWGRSEQAWAFPSLCQSSLQASLDPRPFCSHQATLGRESLLPQQGAIVGGFLIHAANSKKTKDGHAQRLRQIEQGDQWNFSMKAHFESGA
ncbi:hypothetical protein [Chromobacterium vaccinii]|uniref:hypothetical protein n=1 Tax=Chromobacterium vaccinii TaxID=1108595 RepID=UPI001184EA78|nr:hypothetical protein [Chromobacterium vaccinii]